jgi:cold shock CspA family protein
MADSWNKKEREKKKQQNKREKEEKKKERKENPGGKGLDSMMAYIDENGNISSTPPDHNNRPQYNLEDIEISVPKQKPPDPADLIRQGTVTFFNDAKGYGFIRDHVTQESVFVHVNALEQAIGEGTKVSFEVEMGPKGANAVNVKVTG